MLSTSASYLSLTSGADARRDFAITSVGKHPSSGTIRFVPFLRSLPDVSLDGVRIPETFTEKNCRHLTLPSLCRSSTIVSFATSVRASKAWYSVNGELLLAGERRKCGDLSWLVIGLRTDDTRDIDGESVENRCEADRLTSLFEFKRDGGRDESLCAVNEPRRRYEGASFRI